MPFFKIPGTESLAEGSSHKLFPLCADAHGRLHSLMTPPTGEISLGVSGIKPPSRLGKPGIPGLHHST